MSVSILKLVLVLTLAPAAFATDFDTAVKPLLTKYCIACHNAKSKAADLDLDRLRDSKAALAERDVWEKVAARLNNGSMPPPSIPKPNPQAIHAAAGWASQHVDQIDQSRTTDPGRVTARRLNRSEYNNTVRDLLGVNFRPADNFPLDDSGYGFDNIGDVLSLNPALMERYLEAAGQIVRAAIVTGPPPKPVYDRYELERLGEPALVPADPEAERLIRRGGLLARHRFVYPGEYELRVLLRGRGLEEDKNSKIVLFVDGRQVHQIDVEPGQGKKRNFEIRITASPGEVELGAAWAYPGPPERPVPTAPRDPNDNLWVDAIEVRGPFPVQQTTADPLFVCNPPPGSFDADCARRILAAFTPRAWRRPVTDRELDRLVALVDLARQQGDSFPSGIQLAVKAVLVSPHFLFRIERDAAPDDPSAAHRIGDYELATRLSYFLWSSMPDSELFALAGRDELHVPAVLDAQVSRMLADPKAAGFARNFAGQWLELRNLSQISPDPQKFPNFDADLREAMRRETLMFFESVMRDDRPITDFIDGPYTFLNERLAALYGIEGVTGRNFRRVPLDGVQRSGILTNASVLTITSHPNRTSPVLRGIWLLENILASPPPPPPADVPPLPEDEIGTTISLRAQMQKHRADPNCAVCHTKMDGLGFGLENYNPVGAWRTHDGPFEIDPAGELPGNRIFTTPAEMKRILLGEKIEFTRCLAEKLTIFALGRGLESYDKPTIRAIVANVAIGEYRFSKLIREIVHSPAFQMRRGEDRRRPLTAANSHPQSGGPPQ